MHKVNKKKIIDTIETFYTSLYTYFNITYNNNNFMNYKKLDHEKLNHEEFRVARSIVFHITQTKYSCNRRTNYMAS